MYFVTEKPNSMKQLFTLILFLGAVTLGRAQALQGTMETWRTSSAGLLPPVTVEYPASWYSYDSLLFAYKILIPSNNNFKRVVYKETTAANVHGGTSAAKIMTRNQDTAGVLPGVLSNAVINFNFFAFNPSNPSAAISYAGGTPITARVDTVKAWIKRTPKSANDSSAVNIQAVIAGAGAGGMDSIIGLGSIRIGGTINTYTQVRVPMLYIPGISATPNRLLVVFTSSNFATLQASTDSTTLWVDDVSYTTVGNVGIETPIFAPKTVVTASSAVVRFSTDSREQLRFVAYDMNGRKLNETTFQGKGELSHNWAPGIYAYSILNKEGRIIQRDKFVIGGN